MFRSKWVGPHTTTWKYQQPCVSIPPYFHPIIPIQLQEPDPSLMSLMIADVSVLLGRGFLPEKQVDSVHRSNCISFPLPSLLFGFWGTFQSIHWGPGARGGACSSGCSILSGALASIPVHPSLKTRQQRVFCFWQYTTRLIITYYCWNKV